MSEYSDPPDEVVALVRAACEHLPEIREEKAWAGTRWMVRQRNVAHVLGVDDGSRRPSGYRRVGRSRFKYAQIHV